MLSMQGIKSCSFFGFRDRDNGIFLSRKYRSKFTFVMTARARLINTQLKDVLNHDHFQKLYQEIRAKWWGNLSSVEKPLTLQKLHAAAEVFRNYLIPFSFNVMMQINKIDISKDKKKHSIKQFAWNQKTCQNIMYLRRRNFSSVRIETISFEKIINNFSVIAVIWK